MTSFDPGIFQAALLRVAEATEAAVAAAKSAAAPPQAAASSSQKPPVDWSKLISKPAVFEYKTVEEDLKNYKDWLWQLTQYLVTVDENYESELRSLSEDPSKPLEMSTASADTSQRSAKLYGLLASLVRNRALGIVRAAPAGDGFEALRQLTLAMRPNIQSRGLALLTSVTAWPNFNMNKPLQTQLLRLEEAYEETRRAGTPLADELKTAILLRCISGNLKTHLNLNMKDGTKYLEVREEVLRWDRAQQKWNGVSPVQEDGNEAVAMEIDRVEGRGKGKGSKGKGKDKGSQKGKSKSKGKDKNGKSKGSKGSKGKGNFSQGKGKGGKAADKVCYVCGQMGHFAKDCWHGVRNVAASSSAVSGSTPSDWTHLTSVSQQQQQPVQTPPTGQQNSGGQPQSSPQQHSTYRVARVSENFQNSSFHGSDGDQGHFVFDLRSDNPMDGAIRAVHFFIGDDAQHDEYEVAQVRAVAEEIPDGEELCPILLDSGADSAIFPSRFGKAGTPAHGRALKLHDAQGVEIPVAEMRDIEVQLVDQTGRVVMLRERVAISDRVQQPILCFGKMLQAGWGIQADEQVLTHQTGLKIPIELQNQSVTVKGWIRVLTETEQQDDRSCKHGVHAVKAEVMDVLRRGPIGWNLDRFDVGVGRHFASHFQDPMLVRPSMTGRKFRTTLIRDAGEWYVLELCEPLETLIDPSAEFHGYEGSRDLITIITDSEKDPLVMGFRLLSDDPVVPAERDEQAMGDVDIAPEDEVIGQEIGVGFDEQGAEITQQGRLVVVPSPTDKVLIDGVELNVDSSLQSLRTALTSRGLSTSGSKHKCFKRLLEFQKKTELEVMQSAVANAGQEFNREPHAPPLQSPPDQAEQDKHNLTHVPYQAWCPACISFRAREDAHRNTGISRSGGTATVSFDFCYVKSVPEGADPKGVSSMTCLIMVDSVTGYSHATPVRTKSQYQLMVQELLMFCQLMGHTTVTLRCDNEPVLVQVLRMTVNARLSMGLPTKASTPMAYSHSNSLVENMVGRARALAGSLMFALSEKVGVTFSSNSAWWSWALRHACWILNRFGATKAITPYELAFGREYAGALCEFGEPVFGYHRQMAKSSARWKRAVFLGKVDPQDSFLLYDGQSLVLTRSIRRIATSWKGHLAFYVNFTCWSWNYKSGFGGRVVPTKTQRTPISASFDAPQGQVEPSAFFDEEAEQVRQKFLEEQKEAEEAMEMGLHDRPSAAIAVEDVPPDQVSVFGDEVEMAENQPQMPPATTQEEQQSNVGHGAAASSSAASAIPVTPMYAPATPRGSPTTRAHGAELQEEHEAKRAKTESLKKQRIERIAAEHEMAIRAVKISENEVVHTMDEYEADLQLDDHEEIDVWAGEDEVQATGMPEELWSSNGVKNHPAEPEGWIDRLADQVELQRLCAMGVLRQAACGEEVVAEKLTTKFVYDWRLKDYKDKDGVQSKRWLRRSRLVAREYAFLERRSDTYSPATSTHILNLLPLMYLQKLGEGDTESAAEKADVTLVSLDVKDAFLMVPQDKPVKIRVGKDEYLVERNLPGQRMGAKNWYNFLRHFMETELQCQFCVEQPCLAKGPNGVFMLHVDDILFCGRTDWWKDGVLPEFQKRFTISFEELGDVGSSISFLKRKILRTHQGLSLIPGTSCEKIVKAYEEQFGKVRAQVIPCDQAMLSEDLTDVLSPKDSFGYRSIVGICLYLARDRPDLLFPVKELSSFMSRPTHGALQKLKKLVGYLKATADYCVVLEVPTPGKGKWRTSDKWWLLESFTDADWSSNQKHRRSTSCGVHLVCGAFVYGSSRTQKGGVTQLL